MEKNTLADGPSKTTGGKLGWETALEPFFVKTLPSLPVDIKKVIVEYGPWAMGLLTLLSLPSFLGWGPLSLMGAGLGLGGLISLVGCGVGLWSIPGLLKKQISAWKLMFYATLINAGGLLFDGYLLGMIIGLVVSLYVLYQVKSYYN